MRRGACWSASACRACCGSLPVALRGSRSTITQRPRQEHGIDTSPQMLHERGGRKRRRDDGGRQARDTGDAAVIAFAQEEHAVLHARNRVQLRVEIAEGAALAGNVDQIRRAAMQNEFVVAALLEHVAERRHLLHVAAVGIGLAVVGAQPHAGQKRERHAIRPCGVSAICPVSVEP